MTNPSESFAAALQTLEADRDVTSFVSGVFADDAELLRPETNHQRTQRGADGAQQFWQQYVDVFDDVHSEFSRVVHGPVGLLEWTSTGHLANGTEIAYSGVSLLDFDQDGRITRFATYYDTAPFSVR